MADIKILPGNSGASLTLLDYRNSKGEVPREERKIHILNLN
jgi:hypothetical protein